MKKIHSHLYRLVAPLLAVVMTACSSVGLHKEEYSGVSVIALNYSGHELSYIAVEDPKNPGNAGGGDALNPYGGGGGRICCFGIPDKWRPDLQVIVEYKIWPEKEYRRVLTNVPPYSNNEPGPIWIMVHEDDSVEAVVSNAGPGHPDWPGKIKDSPTPSQEYRLKVWERKLKEAEGDVAFYKKRIREFSKEQILEQWKFQVERDKGMAFKELAPFKGPDDPAYAEHLMNGYKRSLEFFSKRLESLRGK